MLTFAVIAAMFVIPPILHMGSVATRTLSSQPDFVVTPEKATAPNSNPSDAIRLLVVTDKETGAGLQARPVDPLTLTDLPDYAPINFGHHYTYGVSPDHKILAVITWPSDMGSAGKLHLVDLNTWNDKSINVRIDNYVNDLTFSADARTLYWTMPTGHDPAHGTPRDYQLFSYDLESQQLSVSAQFPSSFMTWSQHLSSGNLAIFGVPTDSNNLTEDIPHLFIVDPARNRIVSDIRLDGVKAGQFYEQVTDGTPSAQEESSQYVMYSPGLAWDSDHKLLYIAHADDNKITVVDLQKGSVVKQAQIQARQPFLQWIADSLVPAAQAKGGPWLGVRLLLSNDGKRLYVFREKTEMGIVKSVDLRVIATDGMREISHLNDLLTDFVLTPDGKSLLVVKAEVDKSYGFDSMVSREVYILDSETLQEHTHIRIDQVDQLWLDGFSPDGQDVYLRGSSAQWVEGSGWRNWQTTWQLLDLGSYRPLSADESGKLYGGLLHIAP
jgi:DNA-binding beta-propeller fold protein YncE